MYASCSVTYIYTRHIPPFGIQGGIYQQYADRHYDCTSEKADLTNDTPQIFSEGLHASDWNMQRCSVNQVADEAKRRGESLHCRRMELQGQALGGNHQIAGGEHHYTHNPLPPQLSDLTA